MNEQRQLFLDQAEKQLRAFYEQIKRRAKEDLKTKHRIEGFMFAGTILGLSTNEELKALMEKVHVDVLGVTPMERKLQKVKGVDTDIDWSIYDQPPSMR